MNRVVLVGNGFDLAHQLPTRYGDFVVDYLKKVLQAGKVLNGKPLITRKSGYSYSEEELEFNSVREFNEWIKHDFQRELELGYSNSFFKEIILNHQIANWVDFEGVYFSLLTQIAKNATDLGGMDRSTLMDLVKLNQDFEYLKIAFEKYLSDVQDKCHVSGTLHEFTSPFINPEIGDSLDKVLIINFNHTDIIGRYQSQLSILKRDPNIALINIHGSIKDKENPIIFGYGDEVDTRYKMIEELNENLFFEHIKSFHYFKTTNYREILLFMESGPFHIHIVGHSCGLSDRVLLKQLFESEGCSHIRIFHKDDIDYRNKTMEISRHFNDKMLFRRRVLPYSEKYKCPQLKKS